MLPKWHSYEKFEICTWNIVSSPSSVCEKPRPKTPAFKMSMSSEVWSFKNCATNVRTDDKELRSRGRGEHRACPRSLLILPTACSALAKSRHARMTWHPWRARLLAVSNPIPVLAPVTMATRVDKSSPWRICSEDVLKTISNYCYCKKKMCEDIYQKNKNCQGPTEDQHRAF